MDIAYPRTGGNETGNPASGPIAERDRPPYSSCECVEELRSDGDIEETVSFFTEDAENRPFTTDRVLRGQDEIRAFLEDTAASGTVLEPSTFRFEANDAGQVAVFGRLRVRGPEGRRSVGPRPAP